MNDIEKTQQQIIDFIVSRKDDFAKVKNTITTLRDESIAEFKLKIEALDKKFDAIENPSTDDYRVEFAAIEKEVRQALQKKMDALLIELTQESLKSNTPA